jgi:hypothetical protein
VRCRWPCHQRDRAGERALAQGGAQQAGPRALGGDGDGDGDHHRGGAGEALAFVVPGVVDFLDAFPGDVVALGDLGDPRGVRLLREGGHRIGQRSAVNDVF